MVVKKKRLFLLILVCSLFLILLVSSIFLLSEKNDFSVNPDYPLKIKVPLGGGVVRTFEVTNEGMRNHNFEVYSNGLEGLFFSNESGFLLSPQETKEFSVLFRDTFNVSGVYLGEIYLENTLFHKSIPVLVVVDNPTDLFAIVHSTILKYENVFAGDNFGVDIKIYDLGQSYLKEVQAKYEIKSFAGDIVFEESENLVIDESSSFSKIFSLPDDIPGGNYALITTVDYNGVETKSAYLFEVSDNKFSLVHSGFDLFVGIVFFFIIVILFLLIYFIKTRDALLLKLRRQHSQELRRSLELVGASKSCIKKIKTASARDKKLEELKKVKKEIVNETKKKQEKQIQELKKLKKGKKKKSKIEQQIDSWNKEGYNFSGVKKKLSEFSDKEVSDKISDWKKKGYDTNVLK